MDTQRDNWTARDRRAYEPPRLRTIELVAEEVLGIGCKTWMGGLIGPQTDEYCGFPAPCDGDGS